jgi:uncharacterized protein (TIGR03083 family)
MEPAMTPEEHLTWTRVEADRMTDLDGGALTTPVPACPGWDVADLLSHTGWVHRYWRYVVRLPEGERPGRETSMAAGLPKAGSPQHPDGDLVAWFRDGVDQLLQTLCETPPAKAITSGFGTHAPSFYCRRVAQETAIHRWDLQDALGGTPAGFDPALAADGIDELLELWVPVTFKYDTFAGAGALIGLSPVDGGDGWTISVGADSTTWRRELDPGAAVTIRGTTSDLYLFVWNRLGPVRLEVHGDDDLLRRWQAAAVV